MAERPLHPMHPHDSHDALQPHAVEPEPDDEQADAEEGDAAGRPGGHARTPGRDATDKQRSG
jgi:hypothetical protein